MNRVFKPHGVQNSLLLALFFRYDVLRKNIKKETINMIINLGTLLIKLTVPGQLLCRGKKTILTSCMS